MRTRIPFGPVTDVLRNRIYYRIKPFLPAGLRLAMRRWFTLRKYSTCGNVWPILPGSEKPPRDWRGWPQGKQFALVLTHDIETHIGLDKCHDLMKLEARLGFRSSFNFIPEGPYKVPGGLRFELTRDGFEVGVQDLHHDGKLYRDRRSFCKKAERINEYLAKWDAVGFRSGLMFHNLEWMHDLNVQYDSSTFDTDPFEPQPDGVGTIFPFWVNRENGASTNKNGPANHTSNINTPLGKDGYVELPYTLCQDSTLFLLLDETQPSIWKKKIDWIAGHGGMVLMNTHPDYMKFEQGVSGKWEYPADNYETILRYLQTRYSGAYWSALPREAAAFWSGCSARGLESLPSPLAAIKD